ncbi:MAG: serine/threonine-protein kinase [Vicinamibacterales bacterium]
MREPAVVGRVAAAVADGEPISWGEVERLAATPGEQALLRELRNINALSASSTDVRTEPPAALPRWLLVVLLLAAVQSVVATLVLAATGMPGAVSFRPAQFFLVLAFGAAALILRSGGRADRRAQWLMAVYVLAGASFAHPILRSAGGAAAVTTPLQWLALDGLLPYALWRFAQVFPSTERFTWIDRVALVAAAVSLACGIALSVNNLVVAWAPSLGSGVPGLFAREHGSRLYWDIIYPLAFGAFIVSGLRSWRAGRAERKRVQLFALTFVAGAAPLFSKGVLEAIGPPAVSAWMSSGSPKVVIDVVVLASIALIPPATTYAVLARQALSVRLVAHRATKYLLTRVSVSALAVLPAAALARYAYLHSDKPVARLIVEGDGRLLSAWLAVALVLLAARRRLADAVDRRFFLSGNRHQALAASMTAIREANGAAAVAAAVAREIERVFGARAGVLRRTPAGAEPLHGSLAPCPASSALLAVLSAGLEPAVLGRHSRLFALLPAADRAWLDAHGTDLLLPLHRADGEQVALVAAGPKASGLAWTPDDLALLSTLGQAAGLALENALHERSAAAGPAEETWDTECVRCGALGPYSKPACACGSAVQPSLLPGVLHGKFAVERRIGAGGMGVVYRARDLALGRRVALKTLPAVQPGSVGRMYDEARAMAALIHPHLALIFGAELWQRTPVLVMELLEGGTLADRLARGPLPLQDSIPLAQTLAGALAALHEAGLLHGDVKPSNIGFTGTGVPKLLDFGLSRLVDVAAPGSGVDDPGADARRSATGGTPLYLPPEAFEGARPGPAFDAWALALVLFEMLTGRHPFSAPTLATVRRRIAQGDGIDVRGFVPDVPARVADALTAALNPNPGLRPDLAGFAAMLTA